MLHIYGDPVVWFTVNITKDSRSGPIDAQKLSFVNDSSGYDRQGLRIETNHTNIVQCPEESIGMELIFAAATDALFYQNVIAIVGATRVVV